MSETNVTPKILLVEDDEDDRLLIKELLEEIYEKTLILVVARDVESALEALKSSEFDVCLTDYHLGRQTGLDLIGATSERSAATAFILLTGQGSRDIDLAAMQAGASEYLPKDYLSAPMLERTIRYAIERKKVEQQLLELAQTDPLTGLANRSFFNMRLEQVIAEKKRSAEPFAILLIDLDGFKSINDTLGHAAGDQLLRHIAGKLIKCTRESDVAARLGGDEFAVLAANLHHRTDVTMLAERILRDFQLPLNLEGHRITSAASIGISLFPNDADSLDGLLQNADLALYRAKEQGRNRFVVFNAKLQKRIQQRELLRRELKNGLSMHEFDVYYQPQYDVTTQQVVAAEALLRWKRTNDGIGTPRDFLEVAASGGLLEEMTTHVLNEACLAAAGWQAGGHPELAVSVNIAPTEFLSGKLPGVVKNALEQSGLKAKCLELELAGPTLYAREKSIDSQLKQLSELGIKFVVGDFGGDFHGFPNLQHHPVDKVKVGPALIANCGDDPTSSDTVRALFSIDGLLELNLTAVGVETSQQLKWLKTQGCRLAQGNSISPPLPLDQFVAFLAQH